MRIRVGELSALVVWGVVCSASPLWGQQVRLRARQNKVINGIEAELRGDFRARRIRSDECGTGQLNLP